MTPELDDRVLLAELEPVAARLVDRHLAVAKEWFPHELVPWSLGRDADGEPWTPDQSVLSPQVRTALEMNLLTEDDLPSYHRENDLAFGRDGAWGFWNRRWTAEEGRHSIVLRDYLVVTRAVDPVQLERDRMAALQQGYAAPDKGALRSLVYVALQELATRIAHRNTGLCSDEPVCDRILQRIAADENLHMLFFRDAVAAALALAPSQTVRAVVDEVLCFSMPGTAVRDFRQRSRTIAEAGIFDPRTYLEDVLVPTLAKWELFELAGLDAPAEQALERLAAHLERLQRVVRIAASKRPRPEPRPAGGATA